MVDATDANAQDGLLCHTARRIPRHILPRDMTVLRYLAYFFRAVWMKIIYHCISFCLAEQRRIMIWLQFDCENVDLLIC